MTREHIDDVQPVTAKEHYELIMKDRSEIDNKQRDVTYDDLPDWYDEKLFKLGQDFMMNNILSMFVSNLVGLVSLFAVPTISKVLLNTKQSHTACLAYKRYYRDFIYIIDIFSYDLRDPNNKFLQILNKIRGVHVSNHNKAKKGNFGTIYQSDMALAQYVAFGYMLLNSKDFGIMYKPKEEEAIIHLWRVIGYMLGIPDRLNICRKNVKETRELFLMLKDQFSKYLNNPSPEFDQLSVAMLHGLWHGSINLNEKALFTLTYRIHNVKRDVRLGWYSWINLKFHEFVLSLFVVPYIGPITRIICNNIIYIQIYFVRNLSLLAWITLGWRATQLNLYPKHSHEKKNVSTMKTE